MLVPRPRKCSEWAGVLHHVDVVERHGSDCMETMKSAAKNMLGLWEFASDPSVNCSDAYPLRKCTVHEHGAYACRERTARLITGTVEDRSWPQLVLQGFGLAAKLVFARFWACCIACWLSGSAP